MKHLLDNISLFTDKLRNNNIFLFLDYDGTIAPIAQTPQKAVLPKYVRNLLKKISVMHGIKVAVISGRSLSNIKSKVSLKNIIYAGNHGLEIEDQNFKYEVFIPAYVKQLIKDLKILLKDDLKKIKGVLIEDKGLAVAVHYRNVDEDNVQQLKDIVNKRINHHLTGKRICIESGKKVFEIRPVVKWNKGDAVLWLLSRYSIEQFNNVIKFKHIIGKILPLIKNKFKRKCKKNILPIYIGDDTTDENGFKAVLGKGISVFVGERGNPCADYFLKNTEEVYEFLNIIKKTAADE